MLCIFEHRQHSALKRKVTMRLCTSALRTIDKYGIEVSCHRDGACMVDHMLTAWLATFVMASEV